MVQNTHLEHKYTLHSTHTSELIIRLNATHALSGVRGFSGTTGGRTNLAPGRRAWPVFAGSGGGSEGERRWL